ncbi:MAG: hypothetical protein IKY12_06905, partial [Clostridia bacterium]|nr:hypothetical protein [Clostridia bacterium]
IVDEMATYNPKVAIIMIGSNNMGYTVEKNVTDLDSGFDMLRALCPEIKFILITEWWQPSRLETYGDYVLSLNDAYRAYAAKNDDVFIVEGWDIPVKDGVLDESMFKDTQHLNPAAYLILNARTHTVLSYLFDGISGDVDGDGKVTVKDALTTLSYLVNNRYSASADSDFNGKIELIDVLKILKRAVE